MENAIESHPTATRIFSLSNKNLTACYHSDCLATMETINLSHNSLRTMVKGYMMCCAKVLNLDHNVLVSCKGLEYMASLEMLSLKGNGTWSDHDNR